MLRDNTSQVCTATLKKHIYQFSRNKNTSLQPPCYEERNWANNEVKLVCVVRVLVAQKQSLLCAQRGRRTSGNLSSWRGSLHQYTITAQVNGYIHTHYNSQSNLCHTRTTWHFTYIFCWVRSTSFNIEYFSPLFKGSIHNLLKL